ncbi:hypothetical protein CEXT_476851 [Caerostris extrusa]|uniref:Uncharacterized protein n=1 Tax=Caerostris extrusa TaxID=172846 RepID=A0AAV4QSW5_CAEEX|nr:hypothetical protein CEXT_476851 [Caerostris extrusa]
MNVHVLCASVFLEVQNPILIDGFSFLVGLAPLFVCHRFPPSQFYVFSACVCLSQIGQTGAAPHAIYFALFSLMKTVSLSVVAPTSLPIPVGEVQLCSHSVPPFLRSQFVLVKRKRRPLTNRQVFVAAGRSLNLSWGPLNRCLSI